MAIQWISNSIDVIGPIDLIERWILPNIVVSNYDYYNVCPPDRYIDPAFVIEGGVDRSNGDDYTNNYSNGGSLYSNKFDPRTKVVRQSYFPHCALQRWVEHGEENNIIARGGRGVGFKFKSCPEGEEYVTVLRSPSSHIYHRHNYDSSEELHESRIPKILHIASPTNCLPISVARSLSRIVESPPLNHNNHHHRKQHSMESQQLAIYIHSHQSMHNYLLTKEFPTFPEVKEGILCGMGKIEAASRLAVMELLGREQIDNTEEEEEEESSSLRRLQQSIIDEIAFGVLRDIWRYLILWEYGGIAMDVSTLLAILEEGDDNANNNINVANSTSSTTTAISENCDARLHRLMQQWWTNETSGDALIYFLSNYFDDEQSSTPRERVPLTNILGATLHHPFIYTAAKSALRYAIWDEEKSITTTGRTTQIPPIKDGLLYVNSDWEKVKTGDIVNVLGYGMRRNHSIHLLNGNDVLPLSLTSPNRTPWRSIFAAFATPTTSGSGDEDRRGNITNDANMPSEAKIMEVMQRVASEQTYMSTTSLFSCMKYRLDMHMQRDDNSKVQR